MAAYLPVLFCGGGMLLCFFLMSRMHGHGESQQASSDSAPSDDVSALREEVTKLRDELRSREQQELPS